MRVMLPCSPFDPEWLYDELFSLAEHFADDDLRRLVQYIMRENREKLLFYPAAVKLHHATRGGWLHHTWTLTKLAKSIIDIYPALDKAFADPAESAPWTPDNSLLSEAERAEGFVSLFDGKTLNGWFPRTPGVESFEVRDGCIEWVRKGADALLSRDRYDNFVLRLEWKIEKGGNNGVWLRGPRATRSSKLGFEFQMMGDSDIPEPTAESTGSVYRVLPAKALAARPEGEWNEVEIMLNGPHYQATLNGVQIQDVNFDEHPELSWRLRKGFICLSDHGSPAWFRNIRVKKL